MPLVNETPDVAVWKQSGFSIFQEILREFKVVQSRMLHEFIENSTTLEFTGPIEGCGIIVALFKTERQKSPQVHEFQVIRINPDFTGPGFA